MRKYTQNEIRQLSQDLLLNNKIILCHSALQNLGKLEGENFRDIPRIWLNILSEYSNNLIMPCFNYSFPKTKFADLRTLKSEVGILSETFRSHGVTRSTHPMFGFCGMGQDIQEILMPNEIENNPFYKNSVYGRLLEQNALMMFLGIDIRVCTFMVFVEAIFGVKYRYFKPFFGKVIGNFGEVEDSFYHFCLPLGETLKVNFFRVQDEMIAKGIIKVIDFGGGKIYHFYAQPFFKYITQRLLESPYILLQNAPRRNYVFKDGKEVILAEVD